MTIAAGLKADLVRIADERFNRTWRVLKPPLDGADPHYSASLLRLLTAYVATYLAEMLSIEAVKCIQHEFEIQGVRLVSGDVAMMLGEENSRNLSTVWLGLNPNDASDFFVSNADSQRAENESVDSGDPTLLAAMSDVWSAQPRLKPSQGESTYEKVGKVFLALRAATDSWRHRLRNPSASRLDVGLSYDGVRQVLRDNFNLSLTPDEVSVALDLCVDNGQAVPRILLNNSRWLRTFYSGENDDSQLPHQFKRALHSAYEVYLRDFKEHPLTPFDFQKICVTLKDLFPQLLPEPISTHYYIFGRTTSVGPDDVISWLTDFSAGPLKEERHGRRNVLTLNAMFKPCVSPTWNPEEAQKFADSFHHLASAFQRLDDGPKLLLSTCRTHRHAYNATAVEAHSWVDHRKGNFEKFLAEAKSAAEGSLDAIPLALDALHWCIRFLSEARKKYSIFYNDFSTLQRKLRSA